MKIRNLFLVGLLLGAAACSDDDGDTVGISRSITYEVTGNYSGTLTAGFTTASGGSTYESIPGLPWIKQIEYQSSVTAAAFAVEGDGGISGQTITIKVLAGGKQISSTPATATGDGSISVGAPAIVF